jgi:hypothetical protein
MNRSRMRIALGAMVVLTVASLLAGCGFQRRLVSITLIPNQATLGGPGLELQFKAVGNYIHPPESKDITDLVTWESAAPEVVSIDSSGLATSGTACGTNITITATSYSDPDKKSGGIVIGTASVSVTCH